MFSVNDTSGADILREILGSIAEPVLSQSDSGNVDTVAILADLSRSVAVDGPNPAAWPTLSKLCKKIAVAKRVDDSYNANWRRIDGARPISGNAIALLVAVLLANADVSQADEEISRGRALKHLNGALATLDLIRARGETFQLSKLESWAQEIVTAVCDESNL